MDVLIDGTCLPEPSIRTQPLLRTRLRSSSIDSTNTINSTASTSSSWFFPLASDWTSNPNCDIMDALAKETMGLPIFVSHSTGAPVSSGSAEASSPTTTAADSTREEEPILSGKRLSQVLDFALTSLESLFVKSEELIVKSAGLLLESTDEDDAVRRDLELESGRRYSTCNAMRDKDGWVEGWLD